jgi:hypothetical protein
LASLHCVFHFLLASHHFILANLMWPSSFLISLHLDLLPFLVGIYVSVYLGFNFFDWPPCWPSSFLSSPLSFLDWCLLWFSCVLEWLEVIP